MQQPGSRSVVLAVAAVALLLVCVLAFPRLLHPSLSPAELQGVTSPERRIELQQRQAELQNDARATLLQGVAGLLLVVGAVASWRQLQISREGQITERFSRAVDQLGNDKQDVRLGGLYTLERIAADSPADRRTIQAILGAYVRTHASWLVGTPEGPEHPTPTVDRQLPWLHFRATDVQVAMIVLGRRPPVRNEFQLYLSRVDLRGAFLHDARLTNALLRHTNLARAQMAGVWLDRADLEDADLRQANLQRARLSGANLHQAHLQDADLRGADLSSADVRGANFQGAQLEGADFTGARYDDTTKWPDGFQPS
jgi:Pentapeptide repeats (8 copies)